MSALKAEYVVYLTRVDEQGAWHLAEYEAFVADAESAIALAVQGLHLQAGWALLRATAYPKASGVTRLIRRTAEWEVAS